MSEELINVSEADDNISYPNPNEAPPPTECQLTEKDIFDMKSLSTINSTKNGPSSETADLSVLSLADSASNFDEHVKEEFDNGDFEQPEPDLELKLLDGWLFGRKRDAVPKYNQDTVTVMKYPKNIALPTPPPFGISQDDLDAAMRETTVYLVGTAHFSKESQDDVTQVIGSVNPDIVMVELCASRILILSMEEDKILKEAESLNTKKVKLMIKQNGVVQGLLHTLLLSMSAHVTRELKMAPGGEFRAAYQAAHKTKHCQVILGDRPIQITLQRALASLNLWQKIKFFWHVISTQNQPVTQEDIEKCKQKDMLEQLLAEMADEFPQINKIFVQERDEYMVHTLQSLVMNNTARKFMTWKNAKVNTPWQPLNIVAVVGIGHTPGILSKWDDHIDLESLLVIPPTPTSTKILFVTLRVAFWGAVGYGLYRGGSRIARRFL